MNLIPEPQQVTWGEGVCILAWDKKIVLGTSCDASAYDYAVLLQKEMERCMGYGLPVTRGMSKAAVIVLNVAQDFALEEYTGDCGKRTDYRYRRCGRRAALRRSDAETDDPSGRCLYSMWENLRFPGHCPSGAVL